MISIREMRGLIRFTIEEIKEAANLEHVYPLEARRALFFKRDMESISRLEAQCNESHPILIKKLEEIEHLLSQIQEQYKDEPIHQLVFSFVPEVCDLSPDDEFEIKWNASSQLVLNLEKKP